MTARRHEDRPRVRRPGAGRPRKQARSDVGPVDDAIVGAAARLFARQGVASTTMAEIADEVGLGVSSIYYYFRNKQAILERIVTDVNRVPLGILERSIAAHADAGRRLHAFIRGDAAALCEFPFDINEIHRLAGEDSDTFERYWADRRRLIDEVSALVDDGVRDATFVAVDPVLAAMTILADDEAVQNWYRPRGRRRADGEVGRRYAPADIGIFLADMAVRALLVDPSMLVVIRADTGADGEGPAPP